MALHASERAVWEALLPSGEDPAFPGLLETDVEAFREDFSASAPLSLRVALRAALWAAVWLAPVLAGRLPPLTRLDAEGREKALAALAGSRVYILRQLMLMLKLTASLCYGGDERVRAAIGYPRFEKRPRVPA